VHAYMSHLSLSLIHGWLPAAVQAITAVVLVGAIGWRSRRWRVLWLPVLVASGAVLAVWAQRARASARPRLSTACDEIRQDRRDDLSDQAAVIDMGSNRATDLPSRPIHRARLCARRSRAGRCAE
jgi:hypothetical protein